MANDVADLLNHLHDGTLTLEQVAQRFRERKWPRRQRPDPTSYLESAAAELQDPDPYLPGSFDDVAAAYHRGDLSGEQYDVLAEAMAEAKRAEDAGLL